MSREAEMFRLAAENGKVSVVNQLLEILGHEIPEHVKTMLIEQKDTLNLNEEIILAIETNLKEKIETMEVIEEKPVAPVLFSLQEIRVEKRDATKANVTDENTMEGPVNKKQKCEI